jgi:hypothetical protein
LLIEAASKYTKGLLIFPHTLISSTDTHYMYILYGPRSVPIIHIMSISSPKCVLWEYQ